MPPCTCRPATLPRPRHLEISPPQRSPYSCDKERTIARMSGAKRRHKREGGLRRGLEASRCAARDATSGAPAKRFPLLHPHDLNTLYWRGNVRRAHHDAANLRASTSTESRTMLRQSTCGRWDGIYTYLYRRNSSIPRSRPHQNERMKEEAESSLSHFRENSLSNRGHARYCPRRAAILSLSLQQMRQVRRH